jgi:hypothetical protein
MQASFYAKCEYGYSVKKFQEFRAEHAEMIQKYNLHRNKLG